MFALSALLTVLLSCAALGTTEPSPTAAVNAFHNSLTHGDREAVLAALDPAVVIFEGGEAELSRDEYAAHHLAADLEFARAVPSTVTSQSERVEGSIAWVLTRTELLLNNVDKPKRELRSLIR